MKFDHLASVAVDHFLGRLIKRVLVAAAMTIFALGAIYHFTVAGIYTLEFHFGQLDARLIVGGIYAAAALIAFAGFWALRSKPAAPSTPTVSANTREMQLVMLVEAVMLGYSLARKREHAR